MANKSMAVAVIFALDNRHDALSCGFAALALDDEDFDVVDDPFR